ncbi:uncharacterized protein LY89DRAFT_646801, partial [Mollisia scopiformis]
IVALIFRFGYFVLSPLLSPGVESCLQCQRSRCTTIRIWISWWHRSFSRIGRCRVINWLDGLGLDGVFWYVGCVRRRKSHD